MRKYICLLVIVLSLLFPIHTFHTFGNEYRDREICQKIFGEEEGNIIFEAFEEVANLKYVPEFLPGEKQKDEWQTPFETEKSKKGDCEDAVFLFASCIPSYIDGELVWGLVIYNEDLVHVVKVHVWYELKVKKENVSVTYVVEGFSEVGFCGIIPMAIINRTENRQAILKISQSEFLELREEKSLLKFQERAEQKSRMDVLMLGLDKHKSTSQYADITSRRKGLPMYVPHAMYRYFPESWGKSEFEKAMAKDKEIHEIYTQLYILMERIRKEEP